MAGKRVSPIELEDEFAIPMLRSNDLDIEWKQYKIGALFLHYGADCRSGHYIAIPCDGGYAVVDDDKPCEYLATLSVYQNSNIYIFMLVRS